MLPRFSLPIRKTTDDERVRDLNKCRNNAGVSLKPVVLQIVKESPLRGEFLLLMIPLHQGSVYAVHL